MPLGLNSISGLISGIDSHALVDKIIDFERRPAYLLEARRAQEELILASYDALEAGLSNLKAQLNGLVRPSDFQQMYGTVSHPDLLSATVSASAPAGSYSLSIEQVALSHQIVSQGFADEAGSIGTGSVTISLAGEELLTVDLSEGTDSLRDLADAINAAGTDVTASIVNTGSGATPYQLILAGSETGAEQIITVSEDLSGGAGLSFGSVGAVVIGTQAGSSAIASGGHYTGGADANFSFDVVTGGVVGSDSIVIDWSNDQGESGQITLDASYTPGDEVQVSGSMTLSFGAGDLQAGDDWTVATMSGSIQAAQDALINFGSGGSPIQVSSSSNTVTDLISGVTLNLLQADPGENVTVQVKQNTDAIMAKLTGFVEEYNSLIAYFNASFDYDEDAESAGVLLGDRVAMRLDSQIRDDVVRTVQGMAGDLDHLAEIGIGMSVGDSLNTDGSLSIDETRLREALENDLASVISLLGGTGDADDDDIVFLNAGSASTPTGGLSGYELFVTQAATQGSFTGGSVTEPSAGTPLVIDSSNHYLKVSVDGVTSNTITLTEGSYESGAELASLFQSAINADEALGSREVLVSWVDDGGGQGHLEVVSKSYGASSKVVFEDVDDSIYADAGIDTGGGSDGLDVAGYFLVNGEIEEATGTGRILTGSEDGGDTKSISVQVNLTESMLLSQGEAQGRVSILSGVTDRLHRTLDNYLDSVDGIIARQQTGMRDTITDFNEQIAKIDARLEVRRDRYLGEFIRMEQLLSEMSSTSSMLQSLLANISPIGSSNSSSQGS